MTDLRGSKWVHRAVSISFRDLDPGESGASKSQSKAYVEEPIELRRIGTCLSSSTVLAVKYSLTLSK